VGGVAVVVVVVVLLKAVEIFPCISSTIKYAKALRKIFKNPDYSTNLKNLPRQKFVSGKKEYMAGEKRVYGRPAVT
jgi:hypothetical protein